MPFKPVARPPFSSARPLSSVPLRLPPRHAGVTPSGNLSMPCFCTYIGASFRQMLLLQTVGMMTCRCCKSRTYRSSSSAQYVWLFALCCSIHSHLKPESGKTKRRGIFLDVVNLITARRPGAAATKCTKSMFPPLQNEGRQGLAYRAVTSKSLPSHASARARSWRHVGYFALGRCFC